MTQYSVIVDRVAGMGLISGPRKAAGFMRTLAFARWCPFCQGDDHWNHGPRAATRAKSPGGYPIPEPGGCWSVGNGEPCTCPWRPA